MNSKKLAVNLVSVRQSEPLWHYFDSLQENGGQRRSNSTEGVAAVVQSVRRLIALFGTVTARIHTAGKI
jgi:hypothetical protein